MQQAIQFINIDQSNGQMTVTSEAMTFLSSLPSSMKLAPVSIVGPMNTGKSFLANLLVKQDSAFKVALQSQGVSITTGIQIWSQPIQISKDLSLLLMDTQGLQVPQQIVSGLRSPRGSTTSQLRSPRGLGSNLTTKVANTDKLLQLAALLSSTLIFNMYGTVSDRLLEYLEPITRLQDQIQKESKDPKLSVESSKSFNDSTQVDIKSCADLFSQNLVCLIRDFAPLDLKSSSSYAPITQTALLENCLKPTSSVAVKKNKLQEQIKNIFKHRDCHTLSKPSNLVQGEDFQKQSLDGQELDQEIKTIFTAICKGQTGKKVQSKSLNGSMLLGLTMDYLQILQNIGPGSMHNEYPLVSIHSSIERVSSEEANRQLDLALSNFLLSLTKNKPNLPQQQLELLYQKELAKHTSELRLSMADFLTFPEIITECKQFKQRAMILVQDILDENYTISYQLAVGVLGKLSEDNIAQVKQDATATSLKERWTTLYANYLQTDTENMFETLAECIYKSKDVNYIDYTRIDLKEFSSFAKTNEDSEDLLENGSKRAILSTKQPNIIETLASDFDQTVLQLKAQADKQSAQMQLCYLEQARKQQEKETSESSVDTLKQDIQVIAQERNDAKLEIESLQRRIMQEQLSLDDLNNYKQLSESKQSDIQNSQLAEVDFQIEKQQATLQELQTTSCALDQELNTESSNMKIEMQKYESEINLMKEEIEQIEVRLNKKDQKSVMFKTTEQFLQSELVRDYLEPIRQQLQLIMPQKDIKQRYFQKQRELNQMQLRLTDQEFAAKKVVEDHLIEARSELNTLLDEQQKDFNRKTIALAEFKAQMSELELKQNSALMEYVHQKEQNIAHREQLQDDDHLAKTSLGRIVAEKSNIVEKTDQMMQLEEKIYQLSIINQAKAVVVERIVEVIPEMVYAIQSSKSTPSLKLYHCVESICDDVVKATVTQLMKKYKLMQ